MYVYLLIDWLSGVWEYIQETRDKVRDLEQRVRLSKANVELQTIMAGWIQSPLYQRKEDKKDTLLNLEVNNSFCEVISGEISAMASDQLIHFILSVTLCIHGCIW